MKKFVNFDNEDEGFSSSEEDDHPQIGEEDYLKVEEEKLKAGLKYERPKR